MSNAMDRQMLKSNLAPVLSEYGMSAGESSIPPKKKTTQAQKKKGSPRQERQRKQKHSEYAEKDDSRAEAQKQHYLQVYKDMHRGKKICYNEYLEKMRDKVDEQREQIRKKTQQIENKLKAQEEREKEESHRVKRRLQRIELDHNDDFLNRIPKSNNYKTIKVLKKMESDGEIRTRSDREEFWGSIQQPGVLDFYYNKYFPTAQQTEYASQKSHNQSCTASQSVGTRSRTSSTSSQAQTEREVKVAPVDFRPMTGIQEMKESSRPTTRDEGTVTQLGQVQPSHRTPSPKRKLDPITIAKLAAAELDRQYPQQEIPELYCLNMEFGLKAPDSEEVLKDMEATRRDKERRLFINRLRRMYQLSQTHGASAQRIIKKHELSEELFLEGPPLNELLAVDRLLSPEEDTVTRQVTDLSQANAKPWERHLGIRRQIVPILEESEAESTSRTGRSNSSSKQKHGSAKSRLSSSAVSTQSDREDSFVLPPALSLNGVREHSKIVEAKCLSGMWTNYLGVGKSAFAPS